MLVTFCSVDDGRSQVIGGGVILRFSPGKSASHFFSHWKIALVNSKRLQLTL
jgi:hypothetical protein